MLCIFLFASSSVSFSARRRYPLSGSRTCCQGLGFWVPHLIIFPCASARIVRHYPIFSPISTPDYVSGSSGCYCQIWILIGLPAKAFLQLLIAISVAALLALYGSWPPSRSFSRYPCTHSFFVHLICCDHDNSTPIFYCFYSF